MTKINFQKLRKGEEGSAFIALIVCIVLLGAIGIIISSLMTGSQKSISLMNDSANALSLAQGGIEYTGKYLQGVNDWSTLSGSLNKALGTGTFTIQWGAYDSTNKKISVTILGSSGSGNQQVTAVYKQSGGSAINSLGGVSITSLSSVTCQSSTCTSASSCPCVSQNVPSATLPTISVPGGLNPPSIGCSGSSNFTGTISAGTYVCTSGMYFGSNAWVYITGPVTIFTTTLTLTSNVWFNSGGSPANLLIIASGNVNISSNAIFSGAIYAPGSNITLSSNNGFTGAIDGGVSGNPNSITLTSIATLTYNSTAGSSSPYYSQTVGLGGGSSTVSLTNWQE